MPGEETEAFAKGQRETLAGEEEIRQQNTKLRNCNQAPPYYWRLWNLAHVFQTIRHFNDLISKYHHYMRIQNNLFLDAL